MELLRTTIGGFEQWKSEGKDYDTIPSISPESLKRKTSEDIRILDVRKSGEFVLGHLVEESVSHFPLAEVNHNMNSLNGW